MALASRSTGYPVGAFAPPAGMPPVAAAPAPAPVGGGGVVADPAAGGGQVIGQPASGGFPAPRPFGGGGGQAFGGQIPMAQPSSTMSGSDVDRIMGDMAARQQQAARMVRRTPEEIQQAWQSRGWGMGGEHPALGVLRQLFMQRLGGMPWAQGGGQMNILPATGANDPRAAFMRMLQQWMGAQRGA